MTARIVILLVLCGLVAFSWAGACVVYRAAEMGEQVAPVPRRDFNALTIVTVGTGGGYENPERAGPCTALGLGERIVLVDAGRGVSEALRSSHIPVSQPEWLLLTNLMPENTVGLDDLLFTGWLTHRETPLRVIGPSGTRAYVDALLGAYAAATAARSSSLGLAPEGARIDARDVAAGWSGELGGIEVRSGELRGGPLPALAWRFEHAGRSVVVSGTGWDPDGLASLASGADALVHEAVFVPSREDAEAMGITEDPERLEREGALHTSITDVGGLASRAGVHRLLLVRLRPPPAYAFQISGIVGGSFDGDIEVPDDGDEFEP